MISYLLFSHFKALEPIIKKIRDLFTPHPLKAVGVLFSPLVSGWVGVWLGGRKKFAWAVSQKP